MPKGKTMRINLNCPYSDKDKVKALGAKWDPHKRIWYLVDPEDLTPFMPWLPIKDAAQKRDKKDAARKSYQEKSKGPFTTIGAAYVESTTDYGDIPPWEDVEDWQAIKALREACA